MKTGEAMGSSGTKEKHELWLGVILNELNCMQDREVRVRKVNIRHIIHMGIHREAFVAETWAEHMEVFLYLAFSVLSFCCTSPMSFLFHSPVHAPLLLPVTQTWDEPRDVTGRWIS